MNNNCSLLEKAYRIAKTAHQGQFDKGGNPYITHPVHVADSVDTEEEKMVAMLHDVLEDSDLTEGDLLKEGFPEHVVSTVRMLTHDKEAVPDYMEYIRMISHNPLAAKVKRADLCHNMDITRIPDPTSKDYERLEKYKKAYRILEEEMNSGTEVEGER